MNTDSKAKLLPCPFCGAGITSIRENGKMWTGQRYSDPTSVSVMHHCELVDGQPSRAIERVGRDMESAVAAWNLRAQPAQVPEGWKLVPECPTMEMSEAGDDVFREYALNVFSCYTIYTRMIAAAPKPPEAAKDKPVDAVLQMILEQKSKKDALIAKSICPECEGKGECGGQFTGGEWTCEECNGTGKAHGIGSKDT